MNPTENASNIIIAMINNNYIATPEQVSEAYKVIYSAIVNPLD